MQLKSFAALIGAAQLARAQELMRFGCSQLTIDRVDPLVNPGSLPSVHMHQVVGGNSFNVTMTPVVVREIYPLLCVLRRRKRP
jgi:hypothetical protein